MSVIIWWPESIESEGNDIVNDEPLSLSDGLITATASQTPPPPPPPAPTPVLLSINDVY